MVFGAPLKSFFTDSCGKLQHYLNQDGRDLITEAGSQLIWAGSMHLRGLFTALSFHRAGSDLAHNQHRQNLNSESRLSETEHLTLPLLLAVLEVMLL